MEYAVLVQKLGSLHSLLRELASAELYQGEHTIAYTSADGVQQTIHVHIEGTDLQMSNTPGGFGLGLTVNVFPED